MEENIRKTALYLLLGILIIVLVINAALVTSMTSIIGGNQSKQQGTEPANVNVTRLTVPGCNDCFDLDNAINALSQLSVRIANERSVDVYSAEGRELAGKYNIGKAPTLVIQGEIDKPGVKGMWSQIGEVRNGAVVYTELTPVYLDLDSNRMVGRVNATIIRDSSCSQCPDLSFVLDQLKQQGVSIKQENVLDTSDAEAKKLIEKYDIEIVPSMILSGDISAYEGVSEALLQAGSAEPDGTYVLRRFIPPYRNLSAGRIEGIVNMVNIVDKSCITCYNVTVNRQILRSGYGVFIDNETTYDVNSVQGRQLLSKYNITLVPTFLLSPEAASYPGLMQVWRGIGTAEKDGWFVFRNINAIQGAVYKNLTTNQTVGA